MWCTPICPSRTLPIWWLCQEEPRQAQHGSAGNGSAGHLAFEYLKMTADIFMLHVPYRGAAPDDRPAIGRLDAASVGAAALLPFIKAGKVRCIATGSTRRLPAIARHAHGGRTGLFGLRDDPVVRHAGPFQPASRPCRQAGCAECAKAVRRADALKRLQGDAARAHWQHAGQFAQFIATEQNRWQKCSSAQVKPG